MLTDSFESWYRLWDVWEGIWELIVDGKNDLSDCVFALICRTGALGIMMIPEPQLDECTCFSTCLMHCFEQTWWPKKNESICSSMN
jgi:hypothetical protein